MKNFNYANREIGLDIVKDGNKLTRVILNDGGLEFPFANYDKAADFLVSEYGGTKESAIETLNATESVEGLEVSGTPVQVAPKTTAKGTGKKGSGKSKEEKEAEKAAKKAQKDAEKAAKQAEKTAKPEAVEMTFNLPGQPVSKKVQFKTILPDQKPIETEDVALDDTYALHIDIYSQKNRTSKLTNSKTGEVLIENVSLMDVIYKYAEAVGMSFPQADKYIKIKRGLIEAPAPKEKKPVTADELKGEAKTDANNVAPAEAPADNK